jgi:hypothetical protein
MNHKWLSLSKCDIYLFMAQNKIKCYDDELSFTKIDTCHALIDCHVRSL